ncbi:MAG: periplasmic heavy metal sensor [Deltaproteobacteria bacterium]|nr:periplasmic heavy metal sensor [Candidatus Anaeroferrophillacea bacterium]
MSRSLKILLILSLLANMLLAGLLIGLLPRQFRHSHPLRERLDRVTEQLPEDRRQLVRERLREVHRRNRQLYREIRAGREAAIAILTAPTFDEAAFRRQAEEIHHRRGQLMDRLTETTIELARQLDRDERVLLAEIIRRPPRPPAIRPGNEDSDRPRHGGRQQERPPRVE